MKGLVAGIVILAVIAGGGAFYYYRHDVAKVPEAATAAPIAVSTTAVRSEPMSESVTSFGNLVPVRTVNIVADSPAQIVAMGFQDGAQVAAGTPLVVLDQQIAKAQLDAAKAQADADVQNLQRTQGLARNGISATVTLEQAQAKAATSQADVLIRQRQFDRLVLRAPFAGSLGYRRIDVGTFVTPGDNIVRLDDVSALQIEFRMPSSVLGAAKEGMAVHLQVSGDGTFDFTGRLSFIDPAVSTDTRSVLLRAVVANDSKRLRPGLFVRVRLDISTHANALVVPLGALTRELNSASVYVVDAGSVAHRVQVAPGISDNGLVELLDGVKAGDQVVTIGQFRLRDGDHVAVVPAPDKKRG